MRISGRDDSGARSWDQSLHDQFPSCFFLFWPLHRFSASFIHFVLLSLHLAFSLLGSPFYLLLFLLLFCCLSCVLFSLMPVSGVCLRNILLYTLYPCGTAASNLQYFQLAKLGRLISLLGTWLSLFVCVGGEGACVVVVMTVLLTVQAGISLDHKGVLHPWINN